MGWRSRLEKHELQEAIEEIYARYVSNTAGEVATYIPELAKAPPDDFGIALVTSSGRLFEAG